MQNKIEFTVDEQGSFTRLDKLLCLRIPELSRTKAAQLTENGLVTVNGGTVSKKCTLKSGDRVCVVLPPPKKYEAEAENIPIDVVYEDSELIIVNKPKGMVVHPAHGNESSTLVNALLYRCGDTLSGINGVMRPGIVHRIDKDTSGLLVVAKNDAAHGSLAEQFAEHTIMREYRAIVFGVLKEDSGTVDKPIGRHKTDRKRMSCTAFATHPKRAVTHYRVIERLNGFTYIACRLETGRTHQIRVHMSDVGHFIVGDTVYGRKLDKLKLGFEGQCLHAKTLGFVHPSTGEQMLFDSELPPYFAELLEKLRRM